MLSFAQIQRFVILSACGLCLNVGCGDGKLGEVSGTVRLNGEPLPDAVVTFTPTAKGGSTSVGKTAADGRYELIYCTDDHGAEIGEHLVRVSTFCRGDPDAVTPVPNRPERVPTQFNDRSQLTRSVAPGQNVIDLDLP